MAEPTSNTGGTSGAGGERASETKKPTANGVVGESRRTYSGSLDASKTRRTLNPATGSFESADTLNEASNNAPSGATQLNNKKEGAGKTDGADATLQSGRSNSRLSAGNPNSRIQSRRSRYSEQPEDPEDSDSPTSIFSPMELNDGGQQSGATEAPSRNRRSSPRDQAEKPEKQKPQRFSKAIRRKAQRRQNMRGLNNEASQSLMSASRSRLLPRRLRVAARKLGREVQGDNASGLRFAARTRAWRSVITITMFLTPVWGFLFMTWVYSMIGIVAVAATSFSIFGFKFQLLPDATASIFVIITMLIHWLTFIVASLIFSANRVNVTNSGSILILSVCIAISAVPILQLFPVVFIWVFAVPFLQTGKKSWWQ